MGLLRGKAQNILLGFEIFQVQKVKKDQRSKEKDTYKKGDEKASIKKHSAPHLRLGGLRHKKKREESCQKISQEEIYGIDLSIFLSLYPKNLAIASGATPIGSTPIGSAVAHLIERS
jgi:hypothetical protein